MVVTIKHEVLREVFFGKAVAPAPWNHRVLEEEIPGRPVRVTSRVAKYQRVEKP